MLTTTNHETSPAVLPGLQAITNQPPTKYTAPHGTIWGIAQDTTPCPDAPVWLVTTAGHGGYVVVREWAVKNMPAVAIEVGQGCYGSRNPYSHFLFYEEDCNWAVLELYVPEPIARWCFDTIHNWRHDKDYSEHRAHVLQCVTAYNPGALATSPA